MAVAQLERQMKNVVRNVASGIGSLGVVLYLIAASIPPFPGDGAGHAATPAEQLLSVTPIAYFAALAVSGWITKWKSFVLAFFVGQVLAVAVCTGLLMNHGGDFLVVIVIATVVWIALWIERKKALTKTAPEPTPPPVGP